MDAFMQHLENRCGCNEDGYFEDDDMGADTQGNAGRAQVAKVPSQLSALAVDGFVEIELEPEEKATLTANDWIRAGAKILRLGDL